MIISVHMPKSAGTSFMKSLEEVYGDHLLKDYDTPLRKAAYERNLSALRGSMEIADKGLPGIECVHGHFLPVKYLLYKERNPVRFITWLRDPVDRMISHYYYWKERYKPGISDLFIDKDATLEEFCLHPHFQNLYSQFLWAFPLENFEFIGITEHYDDDFSYFSQKYLSKTLPAKKMNVRRSENRDISKYSIDSELLAKIEAFHSKDIELYQRALAKREERV